MFNRIFFASLLFLLILITIKHAIADDIAKVDPVMESGGNAYRFPNIRFEPPSQRLALSSAKLNKEQSLIAEKAKAIFDQNPSSLSMLLIDKGKIIVELYRAPASQNSPQHSMSMSKSLTAYVIGALLCEGKIKGLNDKAEIYAPELKGTVFGEASIRNLLTMSSGAFLSESSGSSYKGQFVDNRSGKVSTLDVIKEYGKRDITSGQDFRYLGNDTQALAFIINSLGGFGTNFERYIWSKSGTEATGYWLIDKNKIPIAYAGSSFVTRDWGRLALWSIEHRNKAGSCFGNFMREATSGQISNSSKRTGRYFPSYGFQTWVKDDTYWWVGYGGQRVGVDPNKGHIIVVTSSREDYMDKVYKLFNTWNKD
jgi:CubicO group peptidase (beta-lactamase class C family)